MEDQWHQVGPEPEGEVAVVFNVLNFQDYRLKKQQQVRQRAVDKACFLIVFIVSLIQLRVAFAHNDTVRPSFEDFVKGFAGLNVLFF